jgi:hypothetical protein
MDKGTENREPSRPWRDRRGIVAMEFALLAPIVLVLFTAMFSALTLHMGGVALEGGTAAAARAAIIGTLPTNGTREEAIQEIITRHVCPHALGLGDVCYWTGSVLDENGDVTTPLVIETLAYVDPRNIGQPEPFTDANSNGKFDAGETHTEINGNGVWDADMGRASAGGSGDHVLYNVKMPQKISHPLLQSLLGSIFLHQTQLVVRNEPF